MEVPFYDEPNTAKCPKCEEPFLNMWRYVAKIMYMNVQSAIFCLAKI